MRSRGNWGKARKTPKTDPPHQPGRVLGAVQTPSGPGPVSELGLLPGSELPPGPGLGPELLPPGPGLGAAQPSAAARCQGKPGESSRAGPAAPFSDALPRFWASSGAVLKMKGLRSPPDTRYLENTVLWEVKLVKIRGYGAQAAAGVGRFPPAAGTLPPPAAAFRVGDSFIKAPQVPPIQS